MRYNQPFGISDTNAPYINGNPSTGTMGSIPPAASIELPQREIVNAIANGGFTPDNADLYQLQRSVRGGKLNFVTVAGGPNAYTASMSPPLLSYAAGFRVWFVALASNTGAMTINIDGLGAKAINKVATALVAGDVQSGQIVQLCYDGTQFQYINAATSLTALTNVIYNTVMPYFVIDSSGATFNLPSGANTVFTNMTHNVGSFLRDGASSVGTLGKFICGPLDAGTWVLSFTFGFDPGGVDTQINTALAINGGTPTPYQAVQNTHGASWSYFITRFVRLVAGDYVQGSAFQNCGSTKACSAQQLSGVRVSA